MIPEFRCPKCGGPYFGRDIGSDENGRPKVLDTVRCHNDDPKTGRPCGWHGQWSEAVQEQESRDGK